MRLFFLAASIAAFAVSTVFLAGLAFAAIIGRHNIPGHTMLSGTTSDSAQAEAPAFAVTLVVAVPIAFACVRWSRILVRIACISHRNSIRRHHGARLLLGILSAPFVVVHAYALLTPIFFVVLAIHDEFASAPIMLGPQAIANSTSMLAVFYGSTLVAIALTIYRGRGRSCARCAYPFTSWRGSADLCPECASPWKRLGGTVYGTRLHRAWFFSGIALLVAAGAIWAFVPR